MSSIDIDNTVFLSSFSGLGNNQNATFSVAVPAQNIPDGFAVIYTATAALSNNGSIPDVQVRYTGLETDWHVLLGVNLYSDPGGNYTITTRAFFTNGVLSVSNFILNISGGVLPLGAFTIDCSASLYSAPF